MHMCLLVIGDNIAESMAPFEENWGDHLPRGMLKYNYDGEWFEDKEVAMKLMGDEFDEDEGYYQNPNGEWDWYQIGGRFSGYFDYEHGTEKNSFLKNELDWVKLKENKCTDFRKVYREIHDNVLKGDDFIGFVDLRDRMLADGCDIDEIRESFRNQPVIKRLKEYQKSKNKTHLGLLINDMEDFKLPEDDYTEKKYYDCIGVYAMLKDGVWISRWKNKDDYIDKFKEMFASIRDDERITIVDYHS